MWLLRPPKARWSWHVFTWLAAVPALVFVALVQVAGFEHHQSDDYHGYISDANVVTLNYEHGWPTPWLHRALTYNRWQLGSGAKGPTFTRNTGDGHTLDEPWRYKGHNVSWSRRQAWPGYANESKWHIAGVAINLFVAGCVLAAPMAATEFWLRRRGGPFRVKIIDFLAVSLLMACGFGFSHWDKSAFKREEAIWLRGSTQYAQKHFNADLKLGYAGPEWLARLYGNGAAVPMFQRVTSLALSVSGPRDIQGFRDLQCLRIAQIDMGWGCDPAVIKALASNKSLQELSLKIDSGVPFTQACMKEIAKFHRLKRITLDTSPIFDDLLLLKSLRRLEELSFCADMVTGEQLAELEQLMPEVEFGATRSWRSDSPLKHEQIFLARVNSRYNTRCELAIGGQLLHWQQAPFTAENLEPLAHIIPTLRVLEITDPQWNPSTLPDLSRFHDLTNVILRASDLPVEFMEQVADLPSLVRVSIYSRPATLEPLLALRRRPPRILSLHMSDYSDEEQAILRNAFGDRLDDFMRL